MDRGQAPSPSEKFLPGLVQPAKGTPAYTRYSRGAQRCYKPMSTRLPFLSCVLLVTVALLVLVEVACREYPVVKSNGDLFGFNITRRLFFDDESERLLNIPRDSGLVRARESSASVAEDSGTPEIARSSTSGYTAYAPFSDYIPTTTPTTIVRTLTTDPGAYIPTTDPNAYVPTSTDASLSDRPTTFLPQTTPDAYIPTFTTIPGAYLPTTRSAPDVITTITLQTPPSAYIPSTSPRTWSQHHTLPSAYVPISTTTSGAYIPSTTPDTYVPTTIPTTAPDVATTITLPNGPPSIIQTFTTIPGAYIPTTEPPETSTADTNPGAYIPTLPPDGGETASTGPGAYIQTTVSSNIGGTGPNRPLVPISTYMSGGLAVVVVGIPSTTALVPVSTYTSGGVAMVVMGLPSADSLVPVSTYTTNGVAMVVMGDPTTTSLFPVSTYTSNGVAVVVVGPPTTQSKPSVTSMSLNPYSITVEPVTSISGSIAYVFMTTRTLSPSSSVSGTTTIAATPQTTGDIVSEHAVPFTAMSYFTASYLSTLVAVAFRVIWSIVYNNARLMEPFYRLVSPSGSNGKHSLGNLYLSMGTVVPEPLLALASGHSYMLLVSTIAALIELVAPLSSELLGVDVHLGCTDPIPNINHPCPPRIIVHLLQARVLQGLLGLIAVLIILTMFLGRTRSSGVYSNPSSVAVMASLLHHPDILAAFKLLDAHDAKVEKVVNDQTYKLGYYQAEGEGMKYGIVPLVKVLKHGVNDHGAYATVVNPEAAFRGRTGGRNIKRHIWRILGDISLTFLMLGALGVVVAYYLDGDDNGFNRFFSSQDFGPRFILVFAAGIVVSQWKRLEREVRTVQPYRHLSSTTISRPFHTILSTTTSTPWSTLPVSIVHFDFFTALVAFCYIISEILVIVIATIPFSDSQYYMGYLAGTYVTFSILGLQILVFIALVSWWRWTGPNLERDPDTLLGVWTLLIASGIREDFEDLGTAGRHDLVTTVASWRKRYWLGQVVGKDGVLRMGIHADPPPSDNRFEEFRDIPPVTVSPPVP